MRHLMTALITVATATGVVPGIPGAPPPVTTPPDAGADYRSVAPEAGARQSITPIASDAPSGPDLAPAPDREPTVLALPDLGVQSQVTPTGMDSNAGIIVPEDVLTTGWYTGSPRLGSTGGSTVIVGHRDSSTQGPGALYGIENLASGASIAVTSRDGTVHRFAVDSVEVLDKDAFPSEAARIFTRVGPPRLVLISCGGEFDEAARSYLSNVIVTALPLPSSTS